METQKLFSLLAASIGLVGALFLTKSVVILTPKIMLQLTSPYSRVGYAPEQIASMAAQKADAVIGIVFVIIAFTIQVISLMFTSDDGVIINSRWLSIWIVLAVVSSMTIAFTLFGFHLRTRYKFETGKIALYDCFSSNFKRRIDPVHLGTVPTMAKELLDIEKTDGESDFQFFKRISKLIGWKIPDGCDISKVED